MHPRGRGRPRKGPHGLAVRELPRRSLRWPAASEARLQAAEFVLQRPSWAILGEALAAYLAQLDAPTRQLIDRNAKVRVSGLRAKHGHET